MSINELDGTNPYVTCFHRGVYGCIIRQGKMLVIQKARGPYTGLFDLPGGSPEAGETPEQTLFREIKEETGCTVIKMENRRCRSLIFSRFTPESGKRGVLKHDAILYDVQVIGTPSEMGDGLDSKGALWVDTNLLNDKNATPYVLMGLKRELISLANEEGCPIDTVVRGAHFGTERFSMIGGVLVFDTKDRLVLQRVSRFKKTDPLKWSYSAAGHVEPGETYLSAALRELKEELGVSVQSAVFVGKTRVMKQDRPTSFHCIYRVRHNGPYYPEAKEVEEIRTFTKAEIQQMIIDNPEQFKQSFVDIFNKI